MPHGPDLSYVPGKEVQRESLLSAGGLMKGAGEAGNCESPVGPSPFLSIQHGHLLLTCLGRVVRHGVAHENLVAALPRMCLSPTNLRGVPDPILRHQAPLASLAMLGLSAAPKHRRALTATSIPAE